MGIAVSDGLGLTARPLDVVARSEVIERVKELTASYVVEKLVLGLPTGLEGQEGASVAGARQLGDQLAMETGLTVEYIDERFTSRLAEGVLLDSGMKRRQRRDNVDKVAAAIILQAYLDREAEPGNSDAS